MNYKIRIGLLFVLVTGLAIVLFVLRVNHKSGQAPLTFQNAIAVSSNIAKENLTVSVSDTGAIANGIADITARYRQGVINKGEAIQETLMEENRKSLDIYGKVIDQNGNPVANADVDGGILINVSFVSSGTKRVHTTTDSEGCFSFTGINGVGLGIRVRKNGYTFGKMPYKRPDSYQPTSYNPAIITVWKLRGPDPLVEQNIDAKIPHDGGVASFDSKSGQVSPTGDLRVMLMRSPQEVRRSGQTFDWTFKIEMQNGGLIPENDAYPYWAPDNGYLSSFVFNASLNDFSWGSVLETNFYVKSSDGQYGRMKLGVHSALTPARIEMNLIFNPSGAKNLEPKTPQ